MDKDILSGSHTVNISQRKSINISGVKKIENFDNLHFILETTMGFMVIKGEELELIKLDTLAGNVSIKGTINSVEYVLENKKRKNSWYNHIKITQNKGVLSLMIITQELTNIANKILKDSV